MRSTVRAVMVGVVSLASTAAAQTSAPRWAIDPKPLLILGESEADTNDMFTKVVGATRLPDGRILVGDLGSFALRLFAPDGQLVKRFGRKGSGPGEIGYLKSLLRCGDSVVTMDIDGNRTSVFTLGGNYVRVFRFTSPQTARPPYQSVCNQRGRFAHFGWEDRDDMKGGAYRALVPLWLSGADSVRRPAIATIPGSERYGQAVNGQLRGSRPLPLGKQTAIAISSDRVYVAAGDRYEVTAYDFGGKPLAPIRETRTVAGTTRADIAHAKEREFALVTAAMRAAWEDDFDALPFPKTLPAYSSLQVDASDLIWVQDYPRGAVRSAAWTVFDRTGQRVANVVLPVHLEVYEIGDDYVLGRFMDPDESVPQVHVYRLRRGR